MDLYGDDLDDEESAPPALVLIYWPDGSATVATGSHVAPDFQEEDWKARRKRVEDACAVMAEAKVGKRRGEIPSDAIAETKQKGK